MIHLCLLLPIVQGNLPEPVISIDLRIAGVFHSSNCAVDKFIWSRLEP